MVALKTADIRNEFKKVSDMVHTGEKVLISRPRNENLVILSEKEIHFVICRKLQNILLRGSLHIWEVC